jgi:hypothetical protein
MSKHEQRLEATIHFWVLKEEKRAHEPSDSKVHCGVQEPSKECSPSSPNPKQ